MDETNTRRADGEVDSPKDFPISGRDGGLRKSGQSIDGASLYVRLAPPFRSLLLPTTVGLLVLSMEITPKDAFKIRLLVENPVQQRVVEFIIDVELD